jgi:hypothetical protein
MNTPGRKDGVEVAMTSKKILVALFVAIALGVAGASSVQAGSDRSRHSLLDR